MVTDSQYAGQEEGSKIGWCPRSSMDEQPVRDGLVVGSSPTEGVTENP